MVYSIVLKFEKIWLSGTLITIRKPKGWQTDMRIPIYPRLSSSRGIQIRLLQIYFHSAIKVLFLYLILCL